MLLDGLDEVFDQESRKRIDQFVEAFGANKFVVTSRIAGYRDVRLGDRFAEFTITDMTTEQVDRFLHRWCRAIEHIQKPDATLEQTQRDGDQQAQLILDAIRTNEGVQRLTTNPLLLTILALIHRNGERLPERRVKLYELAVQTLTADWQLSKKLPNAQKILLPEGEVVELLAPLAYWMHEEKPSGLVTEAEVKQQLAPKLAELRGEEPNSDLVQQAVDEFLRRVRETTGLFVERAPGVYGFMHLTFEEYFAARYIADHDPGEILDLIQAHLHEPRWEEPILLALGYYGGYSPRQINRLVERLFSRLDAYQPSIGDTLKVKNAANSEATLIWSRASEPEASHEFPLKDVTFAAQVLAQVEVSGSLRKKLIEKLIITNLALKDDSDGNVIKQLLKRLRQIEQFYHQGEVVAYLKKIADDAIAPQEMRVKAQSGILYIACGEAGTTLIDCVAAIVSQIEPDLFCAIRDLVENLGEGISPALEATLQEGELEQNAQTALAFLTAMSYVRKDNYDKAISLFNERLDPNDLALSPYIHWSLATCYQEKEEYDKANDYYQTCFEQLANCIEPNAFLVYWRNRGDCQRLNGKYEQALDCFQQMLDIAKKLPKPDEEADALHYIGRVYKDWGKHKQAIAYYQQSCDLYAQLGLVKDVADLWYWLANCYQAWGKYEEAITSHQQSCDFYEEVGLIKSVADQWYWLGNAYKDWGKYEQAINCQQRCLDLRQLEDQSRIALSYYQMGRIYQDWSKHEEAIAHYQQSREIYEQIDRPKEVASRWYNLADCYCDWNKYEQAIECQKCCLELRQALDDSALIALTYYQFGRIYQTWGNYEQTIAYYQQSRNLYAQLEREKDVANQWYWLARCYRDWNKYEQAIEAEQQNLAIRQRLQD